MLILRCCIDIGQSEYSTGYFVEYGIWINVENPTLDQRRNPDIGLTYKNLTLDQCRNPDIGLTYKNLTLDQRC